METILTTGIFLLIFSVVSYLLYQASLVRVEANMAVVIDRAMGVDYVLTEGVHFIVPGNDRKVATVSLKEQDANPPEQESLTKDNIRLSVDMIANIRIIDAEKAILNIENYKTTVESTIATSTNNILGQKDLIEIQKNQDGIALEVIAHMKEDCNRWGIELIRVRFESITPPDSIKDALEQETVAEKQANAAITKAEAEHKVHELHADGERVLIEKRAEATYKVIKNLKELMSDISDEKIMQFLTSTSYIDSMKELSSSSNSKFVLYPADVQRPMEKVMNAEYMTQAMGNTK